MFNDSAHLIQAAAEGQGIALARTTLLSTDERNGVLVRLFDIELSSARKHYLVYPARTANSAKLALFRTWLHDEIEQDRKLAVPVGAHKARSVHRGKRR
jgi:LysR family glycine cleavage system transcriptional activator